jgi:hypothetical protein
MPRIGNTTQQALVNPDGRLAFLDSPAALSESIRRSDKVDPCFILRRCGDCDEREPFRLSREIERLMRLAAATELAEPFVELTKPSPERYEPCEASNASSEYAKSGIESVRLRARAKPDNCEVEAGRFWRLVD